MKKNLSNNNKILFSKPFIFLLLIFSSLFAITYIVLDNQDEQLLNDPSFCQAEFSRRDIKNTVQTLWPGYRDISDLSNKADLIIVGKVTAIEKGRDSIASDGVSKTPFYNVTLATENVLTSTGLRKPISEEKKIVIEQQGDPEKKYSVSLDLLLFEVGERHLLFIKRDSKSGYFGILSPQGRFLLINGKACPVSDISSWENLSGVDENILIQEIVKSLR